MDDRPSEESGYGGEQVHATVNTVRFSRNHSTVVSSVRVITSIPSNSLFPIIVRTNEPIRNANVPVLDVSDESSDLGHSSQPATSRMHRAPTDEFSDDPFRMTPSSSSESSNDDYGSNYQPFPSRRETDGESLNDLEVEMINHSDLPLHHRPGDEDIYRRYHRTKCHRSRGA